MSSKFRNDIRGLVLIIALLALSPAKAQFYEKVISFTDALRNGPPIRENRGYKPHYLIEGSDGNFYGTTEDAPANLFRMTRAGVLTTIAEFGSGPGKVPGSRGRLWLAGFDGHLYGTTTDGGAGGFGTVFRMTRNGALTVLAGFTGTSGLRRGAKPNLLFQTGDGSFFGTTTNGGAGDFGTVFKVTAGGVFTSLVEFSGASGSARGSRPVELLQAANGDFYGITQEGGSHGLGTVFRVTPAGVHTVLADFSGATGVARGARPESLLLAGDGRLYGFTSLGGGAGSGTIFRVTPPGAFEVLAELSGDHAGVVELFEKPDGEFLAVAQGDSTWVGRLFTVGNSGVLSVPVNFGNRGEESIDGLQRIIQGRDGNFYGTTLSDGLNTFGAVFKVTPTGAFTLFHHFLGKVGDNGGLNPWFLMQGGDGELYGTTSDGGQGESGLFGGKGTIFKVDASGVFKTLVDFGLPVFPELPVSPLAGVILGGDGNFHGTSVEGGKDNFGTVFTMTPAGNLSLVKSFTGNSEPGEFDGIFPRGELLEGSDGDYYGVTSWTLGNATHAALVFKIDEEGKSTTLDPNLYGPGIYDYPFGVTGGLVKSDNGFFYGTTPEGVFKMDAAGVVTFIAVTGAGTASLVEGSDALGKCFYGTGTNSVFKVRPDGTVATLITLNNSLGQGLSPVGGLVLVGGFLYGTTAEGGAFGHGTAFRLSTDGVYTKLADFSGNGPSNRGSRPLAALTMADDGNFYGTTSRGGESNLGTVFRMSIDGTLTTLFDFSADAADSIPTGRLVEGPDGNLYGTTSGNGMEGAGSVFRLVFEGKPAVYPLPGAALDTDSYQVRAKLNASGATSSAYVEYWTTDPLVTTEVPLNLSFGGYSTDVVGVALNGLERGVSYHYRIRAENIHGSTTSAELAFVTSDVPSATLGAVTNIGTNTARLHATVNARNADAAVVFDYGFEGMGFPFVKEGERSPVTGDTDREVEATIAGLMPGRTYQVRIRVTNEVGRTLAGVQTFTTLTPPVVVIGAAVALSTTRARVEGTVDAKGSNAGVFFEYGTDGTNFTTSVAASPSPVSGDGPVAVSATLSSLTQGTTYYYRIRATGPGGTSVGAPVGSFSLSILSGLTAEFPDPPPATTGMVSVNFETPGLGGWRFSGEQQWRSHGVPATALASGERLIEYLPVTGFIAPLEETVDIVSGETLTLERSYFETPVAGSGSITVNLKPDTLASASVPEESRAQWRFPGETGWRNSGVVVSGLVPGSYLVECKPVAGRVSPPAASISLAAGESRIFTLTYFEASGVSGFAPLPQEFSDVSANEDLPFAHLGQIRSNVGSSTGFVVKRRVVATAGHVVFDDGTLSHITGLQWLHQRHAGEYEPLPQVPRGYYLAAGYAAQRTMENNPGESSPSSQNLDFAALYFLEEAGRGGHGGYLASELENENEFLLSGSDKILAGYAVEGIPAADQGKIHATPKFNDELTPASGWTWTSVAAHGVGGCSGGPLFVRHSNGSYYPAAIYLGGSGQTVVRAINTQVIQLFLRAEASGNGGGNDTSGGITHTSATALGSPTDPGSLTILIEPAEAREAAGWQLRGSSTLRKHEQTRQNLSAGTYILKMTTLPGFVEPEEVSIEVAAGFATTHTYTYITPLESWRLEYFGTTENSGEAADDGDPDHDGWTNLEEFTAGTAPDDPLDVLRVLSTDHSGSSFTVQITGKVGRLYHLERREDLESGGWTSVASQGPLSAGPVSVWLTDSSPPLSRAFYRVAVTTP